MLFCGCISNHSLAQESTISFPSDDDSRITSDPNKTSITSADTDQLFDYKNRTVEFGSYIQTLGADPMPIEWYIIAEEDNKQLLLSKYILDSFVYHEVYTDITWEMCSLRYWLNNEFIFTAFNEEEQTRIVDTYLENHDNKDHDHDGGKIAVPGGDRKSNV